jgi:hypothetical protein
MFAARTSVVLKSPLSQVRVPRARRIADMVYRGIARGKVIELEDNVSLPEGTEVEVLIRQEKVGETAPGGYPKGSPKGLLAALNIPAKCTSDDVDALVKSMRHGRSDTIRTTLSEEPGERSFR